jgi:hypothetical protein
MTTSAIYRKQFRYSIITDNGAEIRKLFTLKVAIAFAIAEEAIILKRKILGP